MLFSSLDVSVTVSEALKRLSLDDLLLLVSDESGEYLFGVWSNGDVVATRETASAAAAATSSSGLSFGSVLTLANRPLYATVQAAPKFSLSRRTMAPFYIGLVLTTTMLLAIGAAVAVLRNINRATLDRESAAAKSMELVVQTARTAHEQTLRYGRLGI